MYEVITLSKIEPMNDCNLLVIVKAPNNLP
jgi:hypothetical protein